jgi:hypothetical protein
MNDTNTADHFARSRGFQQSKAIARRQALLDFIGDQCLTTHQITAWFLTVCKQPLWHGLVGIESVVRRAVTDKDLYCQKRKLKSGFVGHYQNKPHTDLPQERGAFNPIDYGKEIALMMGYAHIAPRTKERTEDEENELQASMQRIHDWNATQPPRKAILPGIQSAMNTVYLG